MKKVLLLGVVACAAVLYSCKKDSDGNNTPTGSDTLHLADRSTINDKIKVAYGTKAKGEIPAATTTTGTPVLTEPYDLTGAVAGRYIVIQPAFDGETTPVAAIKGYYVKVTGSDAYFKVDYTKARGLRRAPGKLDQLAREGDYIDSAIVIKLPENVIADTISFAYAAYDSLNHVSNQIIVTADVRAKGNAEVNKTFAGNWRFTGLFFNGSQQIDLTKPDSTYESLSCIDGQLQPCIQDDGCEDYLYSIANIKDIYTFSENNNSLIEHVEQDARVLDKENSTCSNLVYTSEKGDNNTIGGWSYNPDTNLFIMVFDNNGFGEEGAGAIAFYKVIEHTEKRLRLASADDLPFYVVLEKQ